METAAESERASEQEKRERERGREGKRGCAHALGDVEGGLLAGRGDDGKVLHLHRKRTTQAAVPRGGGEGRFPVGVGLKGNERALVGPRRLVVVAAVHALGVGVGGYERPRVGPRRLVGV